MGKCWRYPRKIEHEEINMKARRMQRVKKSKGGGMENEKGGG